jgi:DNA-binding NarL/FixJ family response regulator
MSIEKTVKLVESPCVRATMSGESLRHDYIHTVQFNDGSFIIHQVDNLSSIESNTLVMGSVGMTTEDIAATLGEAQDTVKSRRALIYRRLGALNVAHATHQAFEQGLFEVAEVAEVDYDAFSPRQLEILSGKADGLSLPACAAELGISAPTAKTHQSKLAENMKLSASTQQVVLGHLSGLLSKTGFVIGMVPVSREAENAELSRAAST